MSDKKRDIKININFNIQKNSNNSITNIDQSNEVNNEVDNFCQNINRDKFIKRVFVKLVCIIFKIIVFFSVFIGAINTIIEKLG